MNDEFNDLQNRLFKAVQDNSAVDNSQESVHRILQEWCKELDYQDGFIDYLLENKPPFVGKLKSLLSAVMPRKNKLFRPDENFGDGNSINGEALSMSGIEYLLAALGAATIAYVVFRSINYSKNSNQKSDPKSSVNITMHKVLILVINANREGVIDALRGHKSLETDQLYEATQALWLGSKKEFESGPARWFGNGCEIGDLSEYDVCLVRFELNEDDRGFHRDANQMDRLDAFRRLQTKNLSPTVSQRVSPDAYRDMFYSR